MYSENLHHDYFKTGKLEFDLSVSESQNSSTLEVFWCRWILIFISDFGQNWSESRLGGYRLCIQSIFRVRLSESKWTCRHEYRIQQKIYLHITSSRPVPRSESRGRLQRIQKTTTHYVHSMPYGAKSTFIGGCDITLWSHLYQSVQMDVINFHPSK